MLGPCFIQNDPKVTASLGILTDLWGLHNAAAQKWQNDVLHTLVAIDGIAPTRLGDYMEALVKSLENPDLPAPDPLSYRSLS
jgi:hypothetical protein